MRRVVVVLLVGSGVAAAQPAVHGHVRDAQGRPIAHASLSIENQATTVQTDARGEYTLAAAAGTSLIVTADGYAMSLATAGDDVVLIPEQASETIEVHGDPPAAASGAARLDRKDLERLPGTGNDVVRSLAAMPGVVDYPLPLGSSGVVIRGSSPQDSRVLVDDFEVPTLYHDVGFKSVIPAEAIDTLEYIPGGFDVAYGRATSGIVNLTTRAGDDGRAQQAELSSGDLSVLGQGTEGKLRYMVGVRRSTIDLYLNDILPAGIDLSMTTVPRYYDEQIRLDYALSNHWTLRASSLGSDDALEVFASRDRNADKRYLNRTRFMRATLAAMYHDGPWSAKLAVSGIAMQTIFERGLYQHLDVTAPALTSRAEIVHTTEGTAGLHDLTWRLGGEAVSTNYTLDVAMPKDHVEGEPPATVDDPMDVSNSYLGTIATDNVAAWTSATAGIDERVHITGGMRVDRFARSGDVALEPRGELQVRVLPKLVARVSAGAYTRPAEYQTELLANLRPERARQLIAGVAYEPADGVRVQGSLYYTDRDQLVTRDLMTGALGNSGRGTTYGAELLGTLKRGPWFAWLTYSYSHSTRVDAPGMESRLFDYDQPHALNVAASYRRGRWQLGARFRAHSGLPATPIDGAIFDSDANLYYPHFGAVNSVRAPMHHQLDLRIDRTWNWGGIKMTQFLDVQNVYMNDTVVGYFYGFDYTQRAAFHQLPILPTAGVRGEF